MELYAVRFAQNFRYGLCKAIYRDMALSDQRIPEFVFSFYVAMIDGEIVLIDSGFRDKSLAAEMGIDLLEIGPELEALVGDDKEVKTIVITHSHFDHVQNCDRYPSARIIISGPELESALSDSPEPIKTRLENAEIEFVEGEYVVTRDFRIHVVGGHTKGSVAIFMRNQGQEYVIAGDEFYLRENVLGNRPIGFVYDAERNARFIAQVHQEGLIPLPFHDHGVFDDYPKLSPNIVRIF